MATSKDKWIKIHELTLPSGNVAELKRVALVDLIVSGGIPDSLSARAVEMASQTRVQQLSAAELKEYEGVVNQVVAAAMVEPHVGPGGLNIADIDFIDRVQIFNWANGSAHSLRPFRGQPQGPAKSFNAS